jgi:hypothetical protein
MGERGCRKADSSDYPGTTERTNTDGIEKNQVSRKALAIRQQVGRIKSGFGEVL